MPRVIHLAEYTPPHAGSYIPFLRWVMRSIREKGWTAEAVFPEGAGERHWLPGIREAGAEVRLHSGSRRELARWIKEVLAESDEPTILHTHFTTFDVPAVIAARGRPDTAVYWHVHTVLSNTPRAVLGNLAKFSTYGRSVDQIYCPAQNIADGVAKRLGPKGRIDVFPSPLDLDEFPPMTDEERIEFRREMGVPDDAESIMLFGRDFLLKGGDYFLDAVAELQSQGRNVFAIVNRGDEEATTLIAASGLGDSVKLLEEGVIDIRSVFGAADVFVAPSRGEGMPFSVIESLCCSTPVVASDLPGHRFVADNVKACTISERDPGPLSRAITAFLDAPKDEVRRECDDARDWIEENLDARAAAGRLLDAYADTFRRLESGKK